MPRPRWSVVVPTHHCARYLGQTLNSVLEQDPGPEHLEVLVVDDHSVRDDPEQVVRDMGRGRVRFVRQPRNVGHVRTFNHGIALTSGHWVHLLHGDDWVEPGFYAAADRAWEQRPDLAGFVCRYRSYDDATGAVTHGPLLQPEAGVLEGWLLRLAQEQRLQAPSTAVRRWVYEASGGFDEGIAGYGEDWEMWVRVAAAGPVWWQPEALATYRVRTGSLSDHSRLAANMTDMRRVFTLNAATLDGLVPPAAAAAAARSARRELALALLRRARRRVGTGDRSAPVEPVVEALRLWPRPTIVRRCVLLLARWALRGVVRRRTPPR